MVYDIEIIALSEGFTERHCGVLLTFMWKKIQLLFFMNIPGWQRTLEIRFLDLQNFECFLTVKLDRRSIC